MPVVRERVGAGVRPRTAAVVGRVPPSGAPGVEGAHAVHGRARRVRGGRPHHGQPARRRARRAPHGPGDDGRLHPVARRRPRAAVAPGRLTRWGLLIAAALVMVLRAPVYVTEPSFWAEEGTLFFVTGWGRSLAEALSYRPAGY